MKSKYLNRSLAALLRCLMLLSLDGCGSQTPAEDGDDPGDKPADPIVWKLGTTDNQPENSYMNAFADGCAEFVRLVNERSGGRLVIEPYYNSVLGGDIQMFTDIRDGNLDVYHGNPMSGLDARLGFKSLPYLLENYDQVHELIASPDGELFSLLKDIISDQNAYTLACGEGVFRGFINSKQPVHKIEDLKNMTVRVYEDPCVNAFWSPICNSQIISWSECYSALQTGVADGLESAANICVSAKFGEVADYYSDIGWQWMGEVYMVNQDRWNELDPELQEIVQQAAWDACALEAEKGAQYRQEAYVALEDMGVEVYELTDAERADWVKYGRSRYEAIRDIIGDETYNKVMEIVGK